MWRLLVCGLLGVILSACSNSDPWNPGAPNIPRTDVYITNFSAETILAVYLRPEGQAAWGENWLAQPVRGGVLYTYVGEVISGTFDVRMVGEVSTHENTAMALVGDAIGISFPAPPASGPLSDLGLVW